MEKEKLYYQIRFWVPYREYVHVIDVEEFMDGVFGENSPRYYFEYYIYGRKHECYIDVTGELKHKILNMITNNY